MNKKGLKIICAIFFVMIVTFPLFTNVVNAAINETYNNATGYSSADDPNTDDQIRTSVISDALGNFVIGIATLVEKLIGYVFRSVTGTADFPWADRVIFNSIALLDVNFFAPANGSFFKKSSGDDTQILKIVRNTYFTVLSICVAFLTIIVAIAATRMALSAIASEKAKYKEAITKWLFSIVLIFLMHNLMSFIFFVNEAMVETASNILIASLDDYDGTVITERLKSKLDEDTMINNFIGGNANSGNDDEDIEFLKDEKNKKMVVSLLENTSYRTTALKFASDDSSWDQFKNFMEDYGKTLIAQKFIFSTSGSNQVAIVKFTVQLAQNEDVLNSYEEFWGKYRNLNKSDRQKLYEEDHNYGFFKKLLTNKNQINEEINTWLAIVDGARSLANNFTMDSSGNWVKNTSASGDVRVNIIANLAEYLRESAYTYATDSEGTVIGWKPTTVTLSGAILYAIFVAQSVLYFLSYIKRFFYIIILAIMAPAIVLFDFLGKAMG